MNYEKELKTCKHFNGIQHDKCEVGIEYKSIRTEKSHLPCLAYYESAQVCDKREFPTLEEVKTEAEEMDLALNNFLKPPAAAA